MKGCEVYLRAMVYTSKLLADHDLGVENDDDSFCVTRVMGKQTREQHSTAKALKNSREVRYMCVRTNQR